MTSHCLGILRSLLDYWKAKAAEESSCAVKVGSTLLKVQPPYPPPDMSPFFLKQYVKSRHDVFEAYPQLLTEMALRLPYQASLCRGIWTHHLKKAQCHRRRDPAVRRDHIFRDRDEKFGPKNRDRHEIFFQTLHSDIQSFPSIHSIHSTFPQTDRTLWSNCWWFPTFVLIFLIYSQLRPFGPSLLAPALRVHYKYYV